MKKNVFLGLLIIVLVIGFIGCGEQCDCVACDGHDCNYNPELPTNRNETIALFGGRTADVSGNLTQTQWDYAILAIENKINTTYAMASTSAGRPAIEQLFDNNEVKIVVQKGTALGYDVYKIVGYTLYLNFDELNRFNFFNAFSHFGTNHEAKAAPQVTPQLNKQVIVYQNIKEKIV